MRGSSVWLKQPRISRGGHLLSDQNEVFFLRPKRDEPWTIIDNNCDVCERQMVSTSTKDQIPDRNGIRFSGAQLVPLECSNGYQRFCFPTFLITTTLDIVSVAANKRANDLAQPYVNANIGQQSSPRVGDRDFSGEQVR